MEPRILARKAHPISRRDIDRDALKVLYRLHHADEVTYLVGGAVRDLMVGRRPKDFDISTSARPSRVKRLFRNCFLIGRRFRLAHVRFGPGKVIEVATFRRGPTLEERLQAERDGQPLQENLYGDPEQDALRRDFTVNGLFYDISNFSVIDFVGGLGDLEDRVVRSIGDPRVRFREDPVRMIRAVRIAARLSFQISSEDQEAIRELAPLLLEAPPSRLLEELLVLLRHGTSEDSIRLLHQVGLMEIILPELVELADSPRAEEALWGRLRRADAAVREQDQALPDSLMAALLLSANLLAVLDDPTTSSNRPAAVRAQMQGLAERLHFPKRKQERIQQIIVAQSRIGASQSRRRRPMSLVRRNYFPESLAFYALIGAPGDSEANLERWISSAVEAGLRPGDLLLPELARIRRTGSSGGSSGDSSGRRRRRSRGRGRGSGSRPRPDQGSQPPGEG